MAIDTRSLTERQLLDTVSVIENILYLRSVKEITDKRSASYAQRNTKPFATKLNNSGYLTPKQID
jgi:hypothetical protein